jgi:hypothetical protein
LPANAANTEAINIEQSNIITNIKKAENYIKKEGIEKAIIKYKNSNDIFIGNNEGIFFVSPLHPELIGKNQLHDL